jgi:hypothetical protein
MALPQLAEASQGQPHRLSPTRLRYGEVEETLAEQQMGSRLLGIGCAGATAPNGGVELGRLPMGAVLRL